MSDARYNSGGDRITRSYNDGDRCGSCFERQIQKIGLSKNYIWMRVDDITSKLRKIIDPPLGRIPLYDEVLTFNVAKAPQLFEPRSITAIACDHVANFIRRA